MSYLKNGGQAQKSVEDIEKSSKDGLIAYYPFDNFYQEAEGEKFKSACLTKLKPYILKNLL